MARPIAVWRGEKMWCEWSEMGRRSSPRECHTLWSLSCCKTSDFQPQPAFLAGRAPVDSAASGFDCCSSNSTFTISKSPSTREYRSPRAFHRRRRGELGSSIRFIANLHITGRSACVSPSIPIPNRYQISTADSSPGLDWRDLRRPDSNLV